MLRKGGARVSGNVGPAGNVGGATAADAAATAAATAEAADAATAAAADAATAADAGRVVAAAVDTKYKTKTVSDLTKEILDNLLNKNDICEETKLEEIKELIEAQVEKVDMSQLIGTKISEEEMTRLIREKITNSSNSAHSAPLDQEGIVQYVDDLYKDDDLIELPSSLNGHKIYYWKLINITNPVALIEECKDVNIIPSYVRVKGKLERELKKKVLQPNIDNYYFKIKFSNGCFKGSDIIAGSRNIILSPEVSNVKNLYENVLKPNQNNGNKAYYLVVGHYDRKTKRVYRLPHMGVISCDNKKIILFTNSNQIMEYDLMKANPDYRYIGLREMEDHGYYNLMIQSLKDLSKKENAFEEVRKSFLNKLNGNKSETGKIIEYHLDKSLNKGNKNKKRILDLLCVFLHIDRCPSYHEAKSNLVMNPAYEPNAEVPAAVGG